MQDQSMFGCIRTVIRSVTGHHRRIGNGYNFILDGFNPGNQYGFFHHITDNLTNLYAVADLVSPHIGEYQS